MQFGRIKVVWLFLSICMVYTLWMTGFTFIFSECELFPNYTMLAKAFVEGHLFIQEAPGVDTILMDGKRYLFSGPVPALLRLPVTLLFSSDIPTGLMIVLFCAGVSTLFALILDELSPPGQAKTLSLIKAIFVLTFIFNGISLYMVSIPSLHHESISAAMFFLMMSIYFLLKMHNRGYQPTVSTSILIGLSLSLSVGSRFSYVYAVAVLGGIFLFGMLKNPGHIPKWKIIRALILIIVIGMVSLGLLFWYNYLRFGGVLDFGINYVESMYKNYFLYVGYFRYDHFPYNFWSLFFRTPQFIPEFPFLLLPRYILQVKSIGLMPYYLMNTNELTVSIFSLMPILMLSVVPLIAKRSGPGENIENYLIFLAVLVVQIFSIIFTVTTVARYYYDFLALMMMMTYLGTAWLKVNGKVSNTMVCLLGVISAVMSFALPMNAIKFYAKYIDYKSPLLNIFF
ncbi:hypothetical protein ACFL0M_12030 [Thermodesulfobacteriota bacterium]